MSTKQHDMFVRYAPQLARRILAINDAYLRRIEHLSRPSEIAVKTHEWRGEVNDAIIEALSHMEKVVEYYRDLAMAAENARSGPPVWEIKGTALGEKFRQHVQSLPEDQRQKWLNGEWEIGETLP